MCGIDEPRGPSFICGLMLAIYGIHFASSFFISQTPSVIGPHLKFSAVVVEIRPASNDILGGTTFDGPLCRSSHGGCLVTNPRSEH